MPVKPAEWTALLILAEALIILVWDLFAGWRWGASATVSHVLAGWLRAYPILSFLLGGLIFHLIFPLVISNDR